MNKDTFEHDAATTPLTELAKNIEHIMREFLSPRINIADNVDETVRRMISADELATMEDEDTFIWTSGMTFDDFNVLHELRAIRENLIRLDKSLTSNENMSDLAAQINGYFHAFDQMLQTCEQSEQAKKKSSLYEPNLSQCIKQYLPLSQDMRNQILKKLEDYRVDKQKSLDTSSMTLTEQESLVRLLHVADDENESIDNLPAELKKLTVLRENLTTIICNYLSDCFHKSSPEKIVKHLLSKDHIDSSLNFIREYNAFEIVTIEELVALEYLNKMRHYCESLINKINSGNSIVADEQKLDSFTSTLSEMINTPTNEKTTSNKELFGQRGTSLGNLLSERFEQKEPDVMGTLVTNWVEIDVSSSETPDIQTLTDTESADHEATAAPKISAVQPMSSAVKRTKYDLFEEIQKRKRPFKFEAAEKFSLFEPLTIAQRLVKEGKLQELVNRHGDTKNPMNLEKDINTLCSDAIRASSPRSKKLGCRPLIHIALFDCEDPSLPLVQFILRFKPNVLDIVPGETENVAKQIINRMRAEVDKGNISPLRKKMFLAFTEYYLKSLSIIAKEETPQKKSPAQSRPLSQTLGHGHFDTMAAASNTNAATSVQAKFDIKVKKQLINITKEILESHNVYQTNLKYVIEIFKAKKEEIRAKILAENKGENALSKTEATLNKVQKFLGYLEKCTENDPYEGIKLPENPSVEDAIQVLDEFYQATASEAMRKHVANIATVQALLSEMSELCNAMDDKSSIEGKVMKELNRCLKVAGKNKEFMDYVSTTFQRTPRIQLFLKELMKTLQENPDQVSDKFDTANAFVSHACEILNSIQDLGAIANKINLNIEDLKAPFEALKIYEEAKPPAQGP